MFRNFNQILQLINKIKAWNEINHNYISLFTDPLFSLRSPSSAVIKLNRRGFIERQRKGVVVGEFFLALRPPELADVFEKNEKNNKTTSVCGL